MSTTPSSSARSSATFVTVHNPGTNPYVNHCKAGLKIIGKAALQSGLYAFAGWVVTVINPVGGAIIGLSTYASGRLATWAYDKGYVPNQSIGRTAFRILGLLIGGTIFGAIAANAAGFPITFTATFFLHFQAIGVLTVSILYTGAIIVAGVLCVIAVIALVIALIKLLAPDEWMRTFITNNLPDDQQRRNLLTSLGYT